MRRLNILHLVDELGDCPGQLHGVTRLLAWWIPAHDGSRFQVSAATFGARDLAGEYLENVGVRVRYLARPAFDPRALFDLLRLLRRERVDLLHLHGVRAGNLGRLCSRLRGLPCVLHGHLLDADPGPGQRLADRLLASATSHSVAISRRVRDFMVRRRALPPSRVEIFPGGIPLAPFRLPGAFGGRGRTSWRRLHRIPEDHRVVVAVGPLAPAGGHDVLLDAARSVLASFRNVFFVIVGEGPLEADLRRRARDLGIASQVAFLGARDDVPRILAGSDVAVFPCDRDGGPLALFEAMASGCTVVITESCGLADVLEDGATGYVIPPRRPAVLAARLTRLLDAPELAHRLAIRARSAVEHFDVERAVRRLEGIYSGLVPASD